MPYLPVLGGPPKLGKGKERVASARSQEIAGAPAETRVSWIFIE